MVPISRRQAFSVGGGVLGSLILPSRFATAAVGNTLNIAYNLSLPSFDPTVGPSSVNPGLQAIYRSIFDQMVGQKPDLSFEPGLFTDWGWNDDKTKMWMDVRKDVVWHDGSPFTPADVTWSITRMADANNGNPVSFIWASFGDFKVDGQRITADVKRFDPAIFKWMAFLTGYVLPKDYFQKVGPAGFEKKPIGTGPYMVDEYQPSSFLRLKANPKYWGGKPPFETVIFKFVVDATTRAAEIESGSSDVTLEVTYDEYDRLKGKPGLKGVCEPITDIGMIFINSTAKELDRNVRLAATHAVDKEAIIKRLLRGYGVPLDTLEAPDYTAYDPSIRVPYDPQKAANLMAAAGYSPQKPLKTSIQTTRGFKPKDYEMIQAIVGMWRKIGLDAEIEVYEVAKHFELRTAHKLAPFAFYNWGNAIADPVSSTGYAMFGPFPSSSWKSADLDAKIAPLLGEKDEKKRIQGWKDVDRYIAEEGYVLPILQYAQPILYKSDLKVIPNKTGAMQPTLISRA